LCHRSAEHDVDQFEPRFSLSINGYSSGDFSDASVFTFTFVASEPNTTFAQSALSLTNCDVTSLVESQLRTFTLVCSTTTRGITSVGLAAGAIGDQGGLVTVDAVTATISHGESFGFLLCLHSEHATHTLGQH
jgi:hypothetical protein